MSIPKMSSDVEELYSIDGSIPSFGSLPGGCTFGPRCPYFTESAPSGRAEGHRGRPFCALPQAQQRHSLRGGGIMSEAVLEIKNLTKHFPVKKGLFRRTVGYVKAVDGVTFTINKGETLGLIGESGCGKTTVGKLIMQLIKPDSGEIVIDGKHVGSLSRKELHEARQGSDGVPGPLRLPGPPRAYSPCSPSP
ncbi:MAG: ATP-binding cassette domain-containing protein [Oscillospiraceae bacterium]